jgi:hypothetical protein
MRLAGVTTSGFLGLVLASGCAEGAAGVLEDDPFTTGRGEVTRGDDAEGGAGDEGTASDDTRDASGSPGNATQKPDAGTGSTPTSDAGGTATPNPGGDADAAAVTPTPEPDAGKPPTPVDPCAEICESDTAKSAATCANAITIGRKTALANDFVFSGDSRGDGDNSDLPIDFISCADGSADNFLRVYLYPDEQLDLRVTTLDLGYDVVLKVVGGDSCEAPTLGACRDQGLAGESETLSVIGTPTEGWYYVVIDGPYGPSDPEGQGRYSLSVGITSPNPGATCTCP